VGTPSNSACHLSGHPFMYYPGSNLLDFGDEIGPAVCPKWQDAVLRGMTISRPLIEHAASVGL
jgi:hypothetical protein